MSFQAITNQHPTFVSLEGYSLVLLSFNACRTNVSNTQLVRELFHYLTIITAYQISDQTDVRTCGACYSRLGGIHAKSPLINSSHTHICEITLWQMWRDIFLSFWPLYWDCACSDFKDDTWLRHSFSLPRLRINYYRKARLYMKRPLSMRTKSYDSEVLWQSLEC